MYAPGTALNQQNIGTTIRPSSTALLTIDSEDRFASFVDKRNAKSTSYNYSPYDFTITKNQSLMNGFFTRLAVSEVVFPWVIPNINVRTASIVVRFQVGSGTITTRTITPNDKFTSGPYNGEPYLPIGFYRPVELAQRLNNALTAICGFSVYVYYGYDLYSSANASTNLPIFEFNTNDPNNKIQLLPLDYNSAAYPYPATTRQLFDLLGLDNTFNVLTSQIFTNPTYCQAVKYVDIVCPTLVYNQALKDTSSSTLVQDSLCRIYLANADNSTNQILTPTDISGSLVNTFSPPGCAPTTIYRTFPTPKYINWTPNQPISGQLTFQVYDDQGQVLTPSLLLDPEGDGTNYFPNLPLDWQMTVLVSEN